MIKWINKNQEAITITITSIVTVVLAIVSNFLYAYLNEHFEISQSLMFFVFLIVNIWIFFKLSQIMVFLKHKIFTGLYDERYIQQAFITMKALANAQGEKVQTELEDRVFNAALMVKICNDNIKNVVNQCFEFFDNTFSSKRDLVKAINFEVTFMTKSYIDNKITIPAACNRDRTQPLSMVHRKDNPEIYDKTVTAEVYQEFESRGRPQIHIISDTQKEGRKTGQSTYKFIYPRQGDRIKSSIVLPILSHKNELLGTLVVHCDRKNFFKEKKMKFWKAILEIFAVEIEKEKIYLDILLRNKGGIELPF